jgi:putative acetyltransferase
VIVRRERGSDAAAVRAVVAGAFADQIPPGASEPVEIALVDALLGHLDYYPRFGFVPASSLGIEPSVPEWASHFQVRTLSAYDPGLRGVFHHAQPFYEL